MEKLAVRRYVGQRIMEALDLAEMSQVALGVRLGIGGNAVSMIVTGAHSLTVERLVEIAAITRREVTFFLPVGGAPDLASALRAAFPGITDSEVRGVVDFASYLRSPASRVRDDGTPH